MTSKNKTPISYQNPELRIKNFDEVCLGYTEEEAVQEASRCIQCKNPKCVPLCPVEIDIPGFINEIKNRNFIEAARILNKYSNLPAVCGRVCPQEDQCEKTCILGKKGDPIAIGKLERFAADYAIKNNISFTEKEDLKDIKVAIVGSGPAGITCAGELAKMGYSVTIFEALHKPGGVLSYGIPDFRLPNENVVDVEISNLEKLGVKIETNVLIGRTITVDQLFENGFKAVFIGSGAGSPIFMGVDGENLNGVFSANEFLTRSNLMKAYREDTDTPIFVGKNVSVVGGGNVAMDAARTARRFGANVNVLYRRTRDELPAREEEVENAFEEGINFLFLTNPIEFLGNEKGYIEKIKCIKIELGDPDDSGRRRPQPIDGSEFEIESDMVILALGTNPNTIIPETTDDLEVDKQNRILADEYGITSKDGVFAGGDIVTGSATVILAMGAGKVAASKMDEYLKSL